MCTNKPQSTQTEELRFSVTPDVIGDRLDRFLADRSDISRSHVQLDIRAGHVCVNGHPVVQASYRLREHDVVAWTMTQTPLLTPAPLALPILFEDDQVVAVDKPVGLVVHPGAGTNETTLVEALLTNRRLPMSDDPARPGIVHRLDKETSGVLVVAKTHQALESLQAQFAARSTIKFYLAVVSGWIEEDSAIVDAPIGRDPTLPSRMAIHPAGKKALTELRVLKRDPKQSLLLLLLHTGRTHQLRVHLQYIGHPVLGDAVYGAHHRTSSDEPADHPPEEWKSRMMLHAWRLQVNHPVSGEPIRFEAPVPTEFPEYDYSGLGWEKKAVRP